MHKNFIILAGIVAAALLGGWILSAQPDAQGAQVRTDLRYQQPSASAPLGTDHLGRDLAGRLGTALGTSLRASLCATAVALVFAIFFGVLSGWWAGGWVDRAVHFLSSLLFILPGFLLLLVVGSILELKLATLYLIAGCLLWPPAARLVRAEVRVLRSARFVISERASGFSTPSILLRSIIPLTLLPAFIALLYMLPELLGLDLGLSLFGVGAVDPATPTLGRLVYQGLMDARSAWWLAVFPTATMALVCAVAYVVAEFASRGMVAQPDKQSS